MKKGTDLLLSVLILYASFWIYEFSNYAAFTMLGFRASLSLNAFLPTGVASIAGAGQQLVLVKPTQAVFSCAVAGLVYLLLRRTDATISTLAILSSLGIFAASFYWELLSFISFLSYDVHFILFTTTAVSVELLLIRAVRLPARPRMD